MVNLRKEREKAKKAVDTGRHRDAIELLEKVVERAPKEWPAVQQLADLYARAGRMRPANDLYRRLADHYEEDGHHARAAALWQRILRNDASFVGAHLKLGALYNEMGRRVDARRHYEAALAAYRKRGREREAEMVQASLADLEGRPRSPRHGEIAPSPSHSEGAGETTPEESTLEAPPASPPAPGSTPDTPAEAAPEPTPAPGESSAGEAEFVEERLLQGRLFRRYNLLTKARAELELVLERVPDHVEARDELCEVLQEMGDHAAAVAERQRLDALRGASEEVVPDPETAPTESMPEKPAPVPVELAESPGIGDLAGLESVLDTQPDIPEEELAPLEVELELEFDAETPGPDVDAATGVTPDNPSRSQTPSELAAMVEDFRKGVDEQVEGDDFETRYNLGIAYRGMGLLDEAVAEFQMAARDAARLFDCAGLLAQCFVDKGFPRLAVGWVERGLKVPGRTEEEYQELRYELAQALEAGGETARALEVYVELYGENARLRDVARKVRELAATQAGTPAGSDAGGPGVPPGERS